MDTKFSTAIHALILIAGAEEPMTSEQIAMSVGTNATYIRKVTALLRRQGIIRSRQGVKGFELLVKPEELSLLTIYRAVEETERVHCFDLHQNPNDECIVGRYIQPVLTDVFREIEEKAERELGGRTLADCMGRMRAQIAARDKR